MTTISREQALCICFLYEYNKENVEKAEKELKDMVVKQRIYATPFMFKQYVSANTKEGDASPLDNKIILEALNQQIETNQQVIQFINQVYVPEEVMDHNVYSLSFVSVHDIFANILRHSYGFENKTLNGFSSFCGEK
ncbi:uncharacterized protein BX664DRAFT_316028 [Halteromyces radiatus]|uniref:uncharacterized protein n=1 Tax=Halteromyces radiatus TaxID=101107 RepID=UPI0022211AFC|nr:uncharacterized protein BX664DRAFT_316028 [Halteromyces radiatus]KAI8084472.1 hypothetical protein BX664DRAFT_316028 [Halteromyces radiatus]